MPLPLRGGTMFVTIPAEIPYKLPDGTMRTFRPGDVVNEGKYPGLKELIEKALKPKQDKMQRGSPVTKAE